MGGPTVADPRATTRNTLFVIPCGKVSVQTDTTRSPSIPFAGAHLWLYLGAALGNLCAFFTVFGGQ